jgi:hypothetical protein
MNFAVTFDGPHDTAIIARNRQRYEQIFPANAGHFDGAGVGKQYAAVCVSDDHVLIQHFERTLRLIEPRQLVFLTQAAIGTLQSRLSESCAAESVVASSYVIAGGAFRGIAAL